MKYNIHLYTACRVMIEGIEANTQAEAVKLAQQQFDPHAFFIGDDSRESPQWDESPPLGALVDEESDGEYLHTAYHELDGATLYLSDERSELLKTKETR